MTARYFIRTISILVSASILLAISVSLSFAILFSDSFESGNLSHTENGIRWTGTNTGSGDTLTVSTDRARTGTHSAKFHFAAGGTGDDAWSELRFNLGTGRTDFYVQFYIWFPSNFVVRNDPPSNNKLIVLYGNNYADPNGDGMEFLYSSSGTRFVMKNYMEYFSGAWHLQCEGSGGWANNNLLSNWYMNSSYLGKWTAFELHYKSDSGAGDGALQMWVDGVNVINGTNLTWIGAPCSPGYYINGYLLGWANSGYAQDTDIYIDDVVFSDTYVGIGSSPKIPNPPKGWVGPSN